MPAPGTPSGWSAAVRARALAEGFDAVGIAPADAAPEAAARLAAFLAEGRHGDMGWMAETATRRGSVRALWPAARAVIMCAQNYGPPADPLAALRRPGHGAISAYAQGADYHDTIKKRLKRLARWLAAESGAEVKVFVDTAPLMEKPLAEAAGLGWQGKHTNLVARDFGSWLFLGAVVTALDLAPDARQADHCGACSRCLDVCPTRAFPAPYQLDARRCISYLTIEHRGQIPAEFRAAIGNRIYGCDDCLAVCPWNKFARLAAEETLRPRIELTAPLLAELAALDDAAFRQVFAGSAIKRIGRDRFVRNVLIAVGNSGMPALAATAEARLDDAAPLVRGMAVWALGRLAPGRLHALAARAGAEPDPEVRAEWDRARASAR